MSITAHERSKRFCAKASPRPKFTVDGDRRARILRLRGHPTKSFRGMNLVQLGSAAVLRGRFKGKMDGSTGIFMLFALTTRAPPN